MWSVFKNSNCDIIVASRFHSKNFIGNLGLIRSSISHIAISLINFIFSKKSSDPLSGFFICKKKIITKYRKKFFSKGYKILFDILYNSKKDLKIKENLLEYRGKNFHKKPKSQLL